MIERERGKITYPNYRQRIYDFTGLRSGNITPGDIDLFTDYHNKLFVWAESKFGGAEPPFGQKLSFQRLCDRCHDPDAGEYAAYFLVSYTSLNYTSQGAVDYAKTVVTEYRWNGKWREPKREGITLREGISAVGMYCMPDTWIPLKGQDHEGY